MRLAPYSIHDVRLYLFTGFVSEMVSRLYVVVTIFQPMGHFVIRRLLFRGPDNFSVPSQGTNCQCIFLKGIHL